MSEKDPYVQALIALCESQGGYKAVADESGVNPQTIYQITAGIKLPSGNPRGVGPELRKSSRQPFPAGLKIRCPWRLKMGQK